MSQGIEIYDSSGNEILSTNVISWNILDNYLVNSNTTVFKGVDISGSDITEIDSTVTMLEDIVDNQITIKPDVSYYISGDTLHVTITTYAVGCTVIMLGR